MTKVARTDLGIGGTEVGKGICGMGRPFYIPSSSDTWWHVMFASTKNVSAQKYTLHNILLQEAPKPRPLDIPFVPIFSEFKWFSAELGCGADCPPPRFASCNPITAV